MDYEKKYKEALERARLYYCDGVKQLVRDIVSYIFPELKKSEDKTKDGEQEKPQVYETKDGEIITYSETDGYKVVVPKFHEGDWVIDSQGLTHQIERVVENVTTHTFGYDIVGGEYFNDNVEGIRLWNIQDAKPGDVLAIEPIDGYQYPFVAIYKERGLDYFNSYCMIAFNGTFYIDECGHRTNVHPATKEQCDILFEKMKEAGYEWDAEKKELKIDYPDNLPKDNWELIHEFVEKFGRIPKDEDELNTLVEYVLKRQKSAWSADDEEKFRDVIGLIEQGAPVQSMRDHYTNWLKSIKHLNKYTFNEIDKKILNAAILFAQNSTEDFACNGVNKEDVIDWLESLSQRIGG